MKTSTFAILSVLLPLVAGAVDFTEPISVTNTRFRQDRASQKITVNYEFSNQGEPAWVTMDVLTNGVSIGMHNIKTLRGDISQRGADFTGGGAVADDGQEKTIVWDARKDWLGNIGSNASVVVSAWYTNCPPEIYLVVDIAGGVDAESYPVALTRAVPNFADDYSSKASQLWLRYIPAGTFMMGAQPGDVGHEHNDNTRMREDLHEVTLTKPFYAGVFEVTRTQYRLVMGDAVNVPAGDPYLPVNDKNLNEFWGTGFDPSESNETASASFFGRLRAKTGLKFALPTDAQWEYACRAGTLTPYNVDTNMVALADIAWYKANASGTIHPVGTKEPNAWGLYDMHGNVSELCRDHFVHSLGTSAVVDPLRGRGSATDMGYVVRGGYFGYEAEMCRSPNRAWRARDNTSYVANDGIRVFLVLE